MDTLPLRLTIARAYAGHLSIREAALRCGLGRGGWQNWERAVSSPRHDDLRAIARGLGVSSQWLTEGGPLVPETWPGPTLGASTNSGCSRGDGQVFAFPGASEHGTPALPVAA